jgi:segregation and condensation protein A
MLEKMDLEITSEFITMASKLLEVKSKYLLFKQKSDEEVEDPRLELMEQLEEYRKFKIAAENLKDNIIYIDELYYRKKEEIIIDEKVNLDEISIEAIMKILPHILKVKKIEEEANDEKLNKIVRGRIISVEEKTKYIRDIIKETNEIQFTKIINTSDKDEIIATFLSILELIKCREITVEQNIFFDDIIIKRNSEW